VSVKRLQDGKLASGFFEIAFMSMNFGQLAGFTLNADHSVM
jgi:hypothetical protein